jgi:hypothetical protein
MGVAALGRTDRAAAQVRELSVEVGGSTIQPPAGVEGDPGRFLSAGLRAMKYDANGSGVFASFLAGLSLEEATGGDFFSLNLEADAWRPFARGWWGGVELKGFGFEVREPFPYRALGFEGGPSLRFSSPNLTATVRGVGGGGWSRTQLVRYADGPPTLVEDALWRYGVTAEVLAGARWVLGGISGGIHESLGGTYRSAGIRVLAGGRGPALEVRVDAWQTPLGGEVTGGMAFVLPLGGWSLRGFFGKTEPDPLTLAEPGGGGGGILLGRRLLGSGPPSPRDPPLHEILDREEGVARIRVRMTPPPGTQVVQILGDFTLWEPVSMRREGKEWVVDLEIPAGTHHFGFLADDAWFLPEQAPDTVPDEWGRRNATLVIEE